MHRTTLQPSEALARVRYPSFKNKKTQVPKREVTGPGLLAGRWCTSTRVVASRAGLPKCHLCFSPSEAGRNPPPTCLLLLLDVSLQSRVSVKMVWKMARGDEGCRGNRLLAADFKIKRLSLLVSLVGPMESQEPSEAEKGRGGGGWKQIFEEAVLLGLRIWGRSYKPKNAGGLYKREETESALGRNMVRLPLLPPGRRVGPLTPAPSGNQLCCFKARMWWSFVTAATGN